MSEKVTVIVRTFNSEWVLDQALAALDKQVGVDIQLLIVDSGSTDSTLEMVSHYPHDFIAIEPGTYFPGKVLNQAIEASETEIVVFINSDVVLLTPDAIARLIAPLQHGNTAGSFGRQLVRPEADLWVRHDYDRAFPESGDVEKWMLYSLPIAAMKKSVWKEIPFYTDAWGSEDTHWGVQAKEAGYKIAYVSGALAMHSHNYTYKQLASRRRIEGEADVHIYPKSSYSLVDMALSFVKSSIRESLYYLSHGAITKIPWLIGNRAVYVWHYYKGFNHAKKATGITYGNYQ